MEIVIVKGEDGKPLKINKSDLTSKHVLIDGERPADSIKPLDKMNKPELINIAISKGIEMDSNESKADLIAKIKASEV
jgi:hypothetical protein